MRGRDRLDSTTNAASPGWINSMSGLPEAVTRRTSAVGRR
jgi:hypothetical protein